MTFTAPAPEEDGKTRVVCLGTSAYPELGTSFELTVDGPISFEWDLWETSYWFDVEECAYGMLSPNLSCGWVTAGTRVGVRAEAGERCRFVCWTGDVDGAEYYGDTIYLTMDRPRTVGAVFEPVLHSINDSGITIEYEKEMTWAGWPPRPEVRIWDEAYGSLSEGVDYTVEYAQNDRPGTAQVIVCGMGYYTGTYTGEFTINKGVRVTEYNYEDNGQPIWCSTEFGCAGFTGQSTGGVGNWTCEYTYDGTEKQVWLVDESSSLTVTGTMKAVDAGEYTAHVKGTITGGSSDGYYDDIYVASVDSTITLKILPRDLSGLSVALSSDVVFYEGKQTRPRVTVRDEDLNVELAEGLDFSVYSENRIGEATLTITGIGNYAGTIEKTFLVLDKIENLPKPRISPDSSIRSGNVGITINYDGISGYQIDVCHTVDGSEPTAADDKRKKFNVTVDGDTKVRVAAFLRGVRVSEIVEVLYMPSASSVIVCEDAGCGSVVVNAGAWKMDVVERGHDGTPTMKSGVTQHEGASVMTATFADAGVLEFFWKTSCEHDEDGQFGWDHVECLLDGRAVAWADGRTDWTNVVLNVETKGEHTLEWKYVKDFGDEDVYPGKDCAWVDGVKFMPAATTWDEITDLAQVAGLPESVQDVPADKFVAWAKAKGVSLTAEGAASVTLDAYLLNCAPGEETAAAAAFKFSEEALKALMANPSAKPAVGTGDYNGKVKILGATSLSADDWAENKPNALFYKAVLEK